MQHIISPGVVLAVMLTLIAAQLTRVVVPERGPYLWALTLAAVGLIIGELIALSGHLQGPPVGVLHPIPDLIVMLVIEVAGAMVITPQRQ